MRLGFSGYSSLGKSFSTVLFCLTVVEAKAGDRQYSILRSSHFTGECGSVSMSTLIEAKTMMKLLGFLRE